MDAARVARRLGADDSIIVYRRTRETDAGARGRGRGRRGRGYPDQLAAHDQLDGYSRPDRRGPGAGRRTAGRTAPASSRPSRPTPSSWPWARRATRTSCGPVTGVEFEVDVVQVDRTTLMTGAPGVFAGGDALPSERTVTVGVGTARRRRAVSTPTCAARRSPPARSTRLRRSRACTCDTSGTTTGASRPSSRRRPGLPTSRRCWRGCRPRGPFRSGALPLVRQLLRVRRLLRRLPGGCGHPAGQGQPVPVRLRALHRLHGVLLAVPRARHRDGAGERVPRLGCHRAGAQGASSRGSAAIPVPEV